MAMRRLLFLLGCLSWAGTDVTELRRLYETDRMFELRRALREKAPAGDEEMLYGAAVEARFGHERAAIDRLRRFLDTHPGSPFERKANEELAGALERLGQYGHAAQAWSHALQRTPAGDPERADEANTQQLNEALREVPAQTIQLDEGRTV